MTEFPSFATFYKDVTRFDPFPWQQDLANTVRQQGWPGQVAVPTGLGKTGSVMIGVYELARQVHAGVQRTQPLRIAHVVDRRSIVDQTEVLFGQLKDALARTAGPAAKVGEVLRDRFGTALLHSRLHADAKGTEWVSPHTPVLLSMTSHQFVSRLLMRGFGVSSRMAPIHAGLLGIDCLVLFDEPHLSVPALDTILAAQQLQREACDPRDLGVPDSHLTVLGATLPPYGPVLPGPTVGVTHADRAHSVASQRLAAPKTLTLRHLAKNKAGGYAAAMTRAALELHKAGAEHVGLMVNDIALAREVQEHLAKKSGGEVLLVTSRMRPVDRNEINSLISSGSLPAFTVATQTLEAGVDVSFDALVTEACPLPSLIQRMGRLNRYGTQVSAEAVLFHPGPQSFRPATQAVYGTDPVRATVEMLRGDPATRQVTADEHRLGFSPEQASALADRHTGDAQRFWPSPRPLATLHAGWSRIFTQTHPIPEIDIPVEAFIAGRLPAEKQVPEVQITWRDETDPQVLRRMPPLPAETLSVPLPALRAFLAGKPAFTVTDEESLSLHDLNTPNHSAPLQGVMQLRDGNWGAVLEARNLTAAPVVLHADRGGYDKHGWNPKSTARVVDHGLSLYLDLSRWGIITRNTPEIPTEWWDELSELVESGADPEQSLRETVESISRISTKELQLGEQLDDGALTICKITTGAEATRSHRGAVTLEAHSAQVASLARRSAKRIGAPQSLVEAVEWAGFLHDDGKTRPEFQRFLGDSGEGPMLAKSRRGIEEDEAADDHRHHRRAGLEVGWRHEALSAFNATKRGADELVVHLTASHHGWARPGMVPVDASHIVAGDADRFAALNRRYGPWGLAWLEAIVRLADHEASREPRTGTSAPISVMPARDSVPVAGSTRILMPGLAVYTAAEWWAVFGMLAAAEDRYGRATVHFDGHVPVLTVLAQTAPEQVLEEISAHLLGRVRTWGTNHGVKADDPYPGTKKYHTWASEQTRQTFLRTDDLGLLVRCTYADTQNPGYKKKDGQLAFKGFTAQGPWWSHNSTRWSEVFKYAVQDTSAQAVAHATQTVETDQFIESLSAGGLTLLWEHDLKSNGVQKRARTDLLLMVAYGVGTRGLTDGDRFLGEATDTERTFTLLPLPGPAHPGSPETLVWMLQTMPRTANRDWRLQVPRTLTAQSMTRQDGYKPFWADERIIELAGPTTRTQNQNLEGTHA